MAEWIVNGSENSNRDQFQCYVLVQTTDRLSLPDPYRWGLVIPPPPSTPRPTFPYDITDLNIIVAMHVFQKHNSKKYFIPISLF